MNMTVWNPFREMENMLGHYTHATGRGLGNDNGAELNFAEWSPSVDIEESDNLYLIRATVLSRSNIATSH